MENSVTDTPPTPDRFDQWAVVDVMGHQRYAGRVSEEKIAGAGFIRVDVPEITHQPTDWQGNPRGKPRTVAQFTKLLAPGAIHSITPCTEDVARRAAAAMCKEPISVADLPALPHYHDEPVDADPEEDGR